MALKFKQPCTNFLCVVNIIKNKNMSCKNSMADGRAFTDYSSNCALNEFLQSNSQYNLDNNTQYRLFLQRYGKQIMDQQRDKSFRQTVTGCVCKHSHAPHNVTLNPKNGYTPNDTAYLRSYHQGHTTPYAHARRCCR